MVVVDYKIIYRGSWGWVDNTSWADNTYFTVKVSQGSPVEGEESVRGRGIQSGRREEGGEDGKRNGGRVGRDKERKVMYSTLMSTLLA